MAPKEMAVSLRILIGGRRLGLPKQREKMSQATVREWSSTCAYALEAVGAEVEDFNLENQFKKASRY